MKWDFLGTTLMVVVSSVSAASAPGDGSSVGVETRIAPRESALIVRWRNQRFAPDAAPATLAPLTRATLAALGPLAERLEYRLDVSKHGRIVCVTDAAESSVHGAETLLRSTLERFDELFPGAGPGRVVVLARTRTATEAEAFTALAETEEHDDAATLDGAPFRVTAWIAQEGAAGRRAAEAQLVNATTRALLADRYGALPAWCTRGLALHFEELVTGRFASIDPDATERSWRSALKRVYSVDGTHLDVSGLGVRPEACLAQLEDERAWEDEQRALQESWALVAALAADAGAAGIGPLVTDLARVTSAAEEGRWGQDPRSEAIAVRHERTLEKYRGPGVLARVEEMLALGRERLETPKKR
jgi:hypothetical protein